jgi:hypothetical protein
MNPMGPGIITLDIDISMSPLANQGSDRQLRQDQLVNSVVEIHKEDIEICEQVQLGANDPRARAGRLSLLEQPLWQFYRYYGRELGLVEADIDLAGPGRVTA